MGKSQNLAELGCSTAVREERMLENQISSRNEFSAAKIAPADLSAFSFPVKLPETETLPAKEKLPEAKTLIRCPEGDFKSDARGEGGELSAIERVRAHLKAPFVWTAGAVYNLYNIGRIIDAAYFRPIKGGLIDENHPWVTGENPASGKTIWQDNVVFKTHPDQKYTVSDEEIVSVTGKFLCGMVKRSAGSTKYPEGLPGVAPDGTIMRRMPHAINYIHGSAHYNGGWLIFNNLQEAFHYFNNREFRKEIRRFVREEQREITIVFRDKNYDPKEYGKLGAMLRTAFHWYSNTNGPQRNVHWGSKSPFPAINMITGEFFGDLQALQRQENQKVIRNPIEKEKYFQDTYNQKVRISARPLERLFSLALNLRLALRDEKKGNLFFVDKSKLDNQKKLQQSPIVGKVNDPENNRSWLVRRQEFNNRSVDIHDLSRVADHEKGLMPLPPDFDERRDIVIAIDGSVHHTYLQIGGKELHGSMFYRRKGASIIERDADQIKAHTAIILKDVGPENISKMLHLMKSYEGARSLSCTQLAGTFLREAEIHFKTPPASMAAVHSFFDGLIEGGLVDEEGNLYRTQVLRIRNDQSLQEVSDEMKWKRDFRFGAAAPLGLLRGVIQKITGSLEEHPPEILLRV